MILMLGKNFIETAELSLTKVKIHLMELSHYSLLLKGSPDITIVKFIKENMFQFLLKYINQDFVYVKCQKGFLFVKLDDHLLSLTYGKLILSIFNEFPCIYMLFDPREMSQIWYRIRIKLYYRSFIYYSSIFEFLSDNFLPLYCLP